MSFIDRMFHLIKLLTNILSFLIKVHCDAIQTGIDFKIKHLSNRLNDKMNNLMTIDYANRDHLDDTDYLLTRYCQEFPRQSTVFTSRHRSVRNNY